MLVYDKSKLNKLLNLIIYNNKIIMTIQFSYLNVMSPTTNIYV
jgi:hypothetical protein